jgi:16S rRNA (uracil1498-N3)-methyltransferase
MSDRFYSARPITGSSAMLDGPEAHHLLHVMRASVDDTVTVFDGSGAEFVAIVDKLLRTEVDLRIVARHDIDRELPFELTVGVALPKGDRQKWIVEKLTELGVTKLVPLVTERSVAQPVDSALDRLRRPVIEASKQCGRNRLMEIAEPQKWSEWIVSEIESCRRILAHPDGQPLSAVNRATNTPTQIAIGPEGGLTVAEVEAATAAGWEKISLGPRILRIETAAIALAALVAQR